MAGIGSGSLALAKAPVLEAGRIGLWRFNLDATGLCRSEFWGLLSSDELATARSFKFELDRERYAAGRACLRLILGSILGMEPGFLEFSYAGQGKPSLAGAAASSKLGFNLSHSGSQGFLAAAWNLELGVDLEMPREDLAVMALAEWAFNAMELRWLQAQPEAGQARAFYRLWTIKEAVLKAQGLGLGSDLSGFSVLPNESDGAALFIKNSTLWRIHSFAWESSLQAALAFRLSGEHQGEFHMAPVQHFDYPNLSDLRSNP